MDFFSHAGLFKRCQRNGCPKTAGQERFIMIRVLIFYTIFLGSDTPFVRPFFRLFMMGVDKKSILPENLLK